MTEVQQIPREELKKLQKKAAQATAEQTATDDEAESMAELHQLMASVIQSETRKDPAFAGKINEIAVQARIAAERLVDAKQLWKNASLGEKFQLAPGMLRAVALQGLCGVLTQGIYAGVTEQALVQAKADDAWTPEDVTRFSQLMREPTLPLPLPDLPQVQPPAAPIPQKPHKRLNERDIVQIWDYHKTPS